MLSSMLLAKCKEDYDAHHAGYEKMLRYYNGDTDAMANYKMITARANNKVRCNYVQKFVKEEAAYVCGNKITYVSHNGNKTVTEDIRLALKSWDDKHNRELCKNALVFSEAYELYYIDGAGNFLARICTPLNSYVYRDEDDNVIAFFRFFRKKFDDTKTTYADVYCADGDIGHFTVSGSAFLPINGQPLDRNVFDEVPVGIVDTGMITETIYWIIKGLQDGYETNLSDIVNEISDFRNAYLELIGCKLDDKKDPDGKTVADRMKENGILTVPENGKAEWLVKNINDSFIQNTLASLEDKIYQLTSHINNNEKMVSNTSSLALRNRLIGLEQRCVTNTEAMTNCVKTRLRLLFEFLYKKQGSEYDWRDIDIKFTPCIPTDDLMAAQIISQLNGKLSTKTALAQLSFVDNPENELKQLKDENKANSIGSGLLNGAGGTPPPAGGGDTA